MPGVYCYIIGDNSEYSSGKGKRKGKVHPRTGYEGPDGE
jgi:hypothetical protein